MTTKKDPGKPSKPFTRGKALFASGGGATALSVFLGFLWVGLDNDSLAWIMVAAVLLYAFALAFWSGQWKNPLGAMAIVAAALFGLLVGFFLAVALANFLGVGPGG